MDFALKLNNKNNTISEKICFLIVYSNRYNIDILNKLMGNTCKGES